MRAQISTEFLIIFGIVILFFIPTIFYFYIRGSELNLLFSKSALNLLLSRLASTIETVGYSGDGAKIYMDISFPPYLEKIEFVNRGVGGLIIAKVGKEAIYYPTSFKLEEKNITLSGKNYRFLITSKNGKVNVTIG